VTSPATVLIAIGGNSLNREGQRGTIAEQFENSRTTARQIGALVAAGWRVVVTHGNGPQVGFILQRSEIATDDGKIPRLSLDMAVADSQGGLGYIVGNALVSELGRLGHRDRVTCLLTQTVVDADDPAFARPAKPSARSSPRTKRASTRRGTAGAWSRTPGADTGVWSRRPGLGASWRCRRSVSCSMPASW